MAILDALHTRLVALLGGTYPASATAPNRQIPPSTFAEGTLSLPRQNPQFPAGSVIDRRFDVSWDALAYDAPDPGVENQLQGPHTSTVNATLRVQYQITLPRPLVPRDGRGLDLGALEVATRKALGDAAVIRWCLLYGPSWAGLAPEVVRCSLAGPITTERAGDELRVVSVFPLRWLLSASAATSPGLPS